MTNGKVWKVYCHTNKVNGKKYIGITSGSLRKRFGVEGRGYSQSRYFANAINKYGWENFDHDVIADGLTRDEASDLERYLIAKFHTQDKSKGYNIRSGGFDANEISPEGLAAQIAAHAGPDSPAAVPVVSFGWNGHRLHEFPYIKAAVEYYNISDSAIWSALQSENKTAAGVLFRYAKDVEGIVQYSEEYMRERVWVRHYKDGQHAKCTGVVLFDRSGNRVAEFSSMKDAASYLGVYHGSVSGAVRGKNVSVKDFYVRLKDDVGDAETITVENLYHKRHGVLVRRIDDNGETVAEYKSTRQAARDVGGDHKALKDAAIDGRKYHGWYWEIP